MYAIAFFSTVFFFSAVLFIYDSVRNHKSSTSDADYRIGQFSKAA